MNWTEEQLAAIDFPVKDGKKLSPDMRSATVTAAAGSGKTALLVERVIRILCDTENPIPADKIAIMTFTRNSAEEFRRRMTDAVASAARKDPLNTYLSEQLIRFRSAPISTISSFCLGIIRDHAQSFGLPLSVGIIDESKAALLRSDALDTTMEYFYSDRFDSESRDLLFKTFSFRDDRSLSEAVSDIYNRITSLSDPDKWLDECVNAYTSFEAAEKRFLPYYTQKIKRLLGSCRNSFYSYAAMIKALPDDHDDKEKLTKMLLNDEAKLLIAEGTFAEYEKTPSLIKLTKFPSEIGANEKGTIRFSPLYCADIELKADIESMRNKLKTHFKEILTAIPDTGMIRDELPNQHIAVRSLVSLIRCYGDEYTRLKRDGGFVDFSDCERLLLEKLRSDKVFRAELSERFRCIIVDEFQDTNDIQYEIFTLISNRENNLFFVGDIKQSIYAFRGGNPRIMLSLCDPYIGQRLTPLPDGILKKLRLRKTKTTVNLPQTRILKSGCRVFDLGCKHTALPLNKNFRSRQEVIDTVNAMFTGLMTQKYGDVDYNDTTKLVCGATFPKNKGDYISELHLLDCENEEDKVLAEASYTADLIHKMLLKGFPVKQDDKQTRPCNCGDFCILMRSSTHMDVFRQELIKRGIPVNAGENSNYLASQEINLILNYLKVIDNPLRDEELIQVLMSPLYEMSAQELAEARLGTLGIDRKKCKDIDLTPLYEHYKNTSLFACISACARSADSSSFGAFTDELSESDLSKLRSKGHPKCVKFIESLTSFRSFKANNSIERLIRKIYDDTDFYSVISAFEQGNQRLANIRLLLKYAADFENTGGGTLGDFLRYTDNVRKANENLAQASTEDNENCVRIMTFHASKGLEMPIVILAELGKGSNKSDTSGAVVFNRDAGLGLRYVDVNLRYRYKPFGYTAITMAEEVKQKGEELRLLYVAMTRAREKLIMIGKCRQSEINSLKVDYFTADFAMTEEGMLSWILASLLRFSGGKKICRGPRIFDNRVLRAVFTDNIPYFNATEITDEVSEQISEPDIELAERIKTALNKSYNNSVETTARSKFTVTEVAHMIEKLTLPEDSSGGTVFMSRPSFVPRGSLSGKEVGDAYHHVMEHFPIQELIAGKKADIPFVTEVLTTLKNRSILSDAEYKAVRPQHISAFFNSELGQRMLKSKRIEREYPIFAEVTARDIFVEQDGKTMIQGRADMFFYEDDGIVLVDYKSDTKQNLEKELSAYSRQLSIYRTILPIMTGVKVKEILIYSFSCDVAVSV